jgi:hypothetical protein
LNTGGTIEEGEDMALLANSINKFKPLDLIAWIFELIISAF